MYSKIYIKTLLLSMLVVIAGCTPSASYMKSAQEQEASLAAVQAQALSHQSRTSDMPIIIICNQVDSSNALCIKRSVPNGEIDSLVK